MEKNCSVMTHKRTHKQIPSFSCLSLVRSPDLRGRGWLCDRGILEINLGVFAALGVEVQTARSDTK